nr:hypothetical protein [uncultured Shinella sp.]
MSKIVVLGLEGEDGIWVADLDAGTVAAVTGSAANAFRKADKAFVSGIKFAAVAETATSLSGGFYDK